MIFENPFKYRRKWERRGKKNRLYRNIGGVVGMWVIAALGYGYFIMPPPTSPDAVKLETISKGLSVSSVSRKGEEGSVNVYPVSSGSVLSKNPDQEMIDERIRELKKVSPLFGKPFLHTAFAIQGDSLAMQSIVSHARQLDMVFPDWLSLAESDCTADETIDWNVFETMNKYHVLVIPRFSNTVSVGWATHFSSILNNRKRSACLIDNLKQRILNRSVKGINVDVQNIAATDRDAYTDWLLSLTESFHESDLSVMVSVPPESPVLDYENIGRIVDTVVVKGYNEHSTAWNPGPVSGKYWFQKSLNALLQKLPPSKTMVAVGLHGYDWNAVTGNDPEEASFEKTLRLAENTKADIVWDGQSWNNSFSYKASDANDHEVWFLDAISVWNQYSWIQGRQFRGVALSHLGGEDASVWKFFSRYSVDAKPAGLSQRVSETQVQTADTPLSGTGKETAMTGKLLSSSEFPSVFDPKSLEKLPYEDTVKIQGMGKMYKVLSLRQEWVRELSMSGKATVRSEYVRLPKNLTVSRFGRGKPKTVALAFYGGPDSQQSERILDILQTYRIRATFFPSVGSAKEQSRLIGRTYEDGHLLGNQTSWKENTAEQSKQELENMEQSLKSASGHRTLLAYAPYDTGASAPFRPHEAESLYAAGHRGYVFMGSPDVDTRSLQGSGAESADSIISRLKSEWSNIIALPDDSENGVRTVQTLEKLIPTLQTAGYSFVTPTDMLGVSRDALMPEISVRERLSLIWDGFVSGTKTWAWNFLVFLFIITTVVSVLRIVFLGALVLHSSKSQDKKHFFPRFLKMPPVTILVPAYNEEKVIERTILWLLSSDYPEFEILVIDDGSTDATAENVRKVMETHPNVRLISKKNEGKSLALNVGFREAKHKYIVTVDADTIVLPKTVYHLIEPFSDKRVDAVCGNIWVGNVKNILTAFQEVEYVTGQNYDRRAFDALNCISVVPGATGAWKKQKVIDIGGYSGDTLVEDADLTLTLLEHGGRIVYAPLARSVTEAPEKVGPLFKQRFRWSYGTFQCFWKHRHTFGKWTLGVVALPNMLLFQVIFPALSPIGDIVLLCAIFFGNLQPILAGYLIFFTMDAVISGIAYTLDKKSFANIWVILIQRFFYRQFMYFVTFKSIFAALNGSHHGWNKLERKGTVVVEETV